jgi:hypothetical protein
LIPNPLVPGNDQLGCRAGLSCPMCGRQFTMSSRQRAKARIGKPIYCSRKCAAAQNCRQTRETIKRCTRCGSLFAGHGNRRFCSIECRNRQQAENRKTDCVCEYCGRGVVARKGQRFCSNQCAGYYQGGLHPDIGPLVFRVDPLEHFGLVAKIARKFVPRRPYRYGYVPIEDTDQFQDGCVGLLFACARFDETRGGQFSTYAWAYIRGFILRGRNDWFRSDVADAYLGLNADSMVSTRR